jgi:type II secretion system protein N
MKERLKKFAPRLLFPLFYLVCLFVFMAWTFPFDTLRDRIVVGFNADQRAANGKKELKIDELGSYWITGVKAKGVHLVSPSTDPEKAPVDLKLDEFTARVSVFPLLVGTKSVGFGLSALGGTIDGNFEDKSKERSLEANLDGIDLAQVDNIKAAIGGPMEGKIGGKIKLDLPEGKVAKANGAVDLEIKDVAIGDGKSKLFSMLPLPRAGLGNITLDADCKDGVLKIAKIAAPGKDLELQGDGKIQLRDNFGESILDMNLKFKVNDGYRGKNDSTKSLFGAPGSTITPLIEALPPPNGLKGGKCADGFYGVHVRGTFDRPIIEPNCGAVGLAKPAVKP